jgi:hypothetical protein
VVKKHLEDMPNLDGDILVNNQVSDVRLIVESPDADG